jgi:hypothetical protein
LAKASSPTSYWTLIVRAQGTGAEARTALGELVGRYENFVVWLIRRYGHPPDTSPEDLKQEFFTGIVRRDDITKLDRSRGSFRSWLGTAVRRFLANEWDKWRAATDGRNQTTAALFDAFHRSTPEDELCVRAFAEHTLLRVLEAQRREAPDKQRFDVIARFLPGPQMDLVALEPLARSLGMKRMTLAKAISVARSRHRKLLRAEIRDGVTIDDVPPDAPDEARQAAEDQAVDEELVELGRSFDAKEQTSVILEVP